MKIGDRQIGKGSPPYIIAEACNNFNGDINIAREMIDVAKEIGCDAIKFQMRLQSNRLNVGEHIKLQEYCEEVDIPYLCTAFDSAGLMNLAYMDVPAIKIGSAECINEDFLKKAKLTKIPLIISTGGCEKSDVNMIAQYADAIMHCTSIYPTPYNRVNLEMIPYYGIQYGLPIGLSDHTNTIYTSLAAVALGAEIIEKHFILDYNMDTTDVEVSLDPVDFHELIVGCHAVYESLGMEKEYFPEEREKLEAYRG